MDKRLLTGVASALGFLGSSLEQKRHYGRPLSRHYRNPDDPVQARRIDAAKAKRKRKACALHNQTLRAEHGQLAHRSPGFVDGMPANIVPASLSPMYIAK